jgi:enoyl-CoA hydratase
MPTYQHILTEIDGPVALARLNRPQVLNALSGELLDELVAALESFDDDENIRAIILTGNDRAFAAGADIKEMAGASVIDMYQRMRFGQWERIRKLRKPLIAAVSGFCLGGGNELAMSCDMIVAAESARFGQPEINIGVIPGASIGMENRSSWKAITSPASTARSRIITKRWSPLSSSAL